MALEEGKRARLKQPLVEGVVVDVQYNKQERCLEHCLEWTTDVNNDGVPEIHRRWFLEDELEEVA